MSGMDYILVGAIAIALVGAAVTVWLATRGGMR